MNIRLRPGTLLVVKDPPETALRTADGVTLHYPDVERVYACSGHVLLHDPHYLDIDLTDRHIFWQKWTDRTFEWNGTTLWVVNELAVLAYVEQDPNMNKDQLKKEVSEYIENEIQNDDDTGEVDLEDAAAKVSAFIEEVDDADTDDGDDSVEDETPESSS